MAASSGPDVIDAGLVLALDAADRNSFDSNENLLTYSKDFSAGWSSSLTVTLNNAIAPDGTLTAAKIQRPINSGNSAILNHPALSTNTNYCYSAFIKLASTPDATYSVCSLSSISDLISPAYASISYNFVTGTISSFGNLPTISGVIPYPNGWYRLYMVINTSSQTNAFLEIRPLSNNLVSDFYIWGAQLERGSSPSPYYPTTSTAKIRGSTLIDLTGRGNTGTLVNGPTYSSSNNGSIVFDGANDCIVVNDGNNGVLSGSFASFTVITWFYPTVVVDYNNVLDCNSGYYTSGNIGPRLEMNSSGTLGWVYSNITGDNNQFYSHIVLSSGLSANNWHCAAITYNGSGNSSTTYYNGTATGISRGTIGTPTGFVGSINSFNIGRGFYNARYFNGRIPQVSIYNRALTAAEVQQNFNATRSRFGI